MRGNFATVSEIADYLRIDPQTVQSWIDDGVLPAVRMGPNDHRVKVSDLEHFIATHIHTERDAAPVETRPDEPVDAHGRAGPARVRFALALADTFRAATESGGPELSSRLRALATAAEEFARVLDSLDAD